MPTQTEKRLARKAEREPRYIIVDDPEKPTKYWRYRSWSDSRADAHVFTHYQRDWWPTLPDGGVWLLVDEEIQAKAAKNSGGPSAVPPMTMCDRGSCGHADHKKPQYPDWAHKADKELSTPSSECLKSAELMTLPLLAGRNGVYETFHDSEDRLIAFITIADDGHQRIKQIVRAVNSYDASQRLIRELVDAATAALSLLDNIGTGKWAQTPAGDKLRAVIAKAEGKEQLAHDPRIFCPSCGEQIPGRTANCS